MSATFLINDGQHRKAAIVKAIEFDERLKDETIATVKICPEANMFTDLNKHAVNTSKSLNTLYGSKTPWQLLTKQVATQVPFLRKYTDKEKDSLANYGAKLFALNVFYDVNRCIIKSPVNIEETGFLVDFWTTIVADM